MSQCDGKTRVELVVTMYCTYIYIVKERESVCVSIQTSSTFHEYVRVLYIHAWIMLYI